jgi:acyl-CoA synthetase (AMP-forming)/AMP-acid ligase II
LLLLAAIGVPVYLLPHFRPTEALEAIERRHAMMFVGVPAMYRMMLEAGAVGRDLSSVRLWASGADTLPDDIVAVFQRKGGAIRLPAFERAIGRATFVDGYGMVELAGGVAVRVFPPFPMPGRGLMRTLRGHRVRLVDANGDDVLRGEVGEIAVQGRGVMRGYYQTVPTDDVFTPDGWLRTGDLARARGLGFFELAGRKKDVVKHGGFSVFCSEVERVLEEHPAIAEAAVFGQPDDRKGEIPVAVVRINVGAAVTPEQLRAFAAERLSGYKVPQRIVAVETLPRTGTGKVNKRELQASFHALQADPAR